MIKEGSFQSRRPPAFPLPGTARLLLCLAAGLLAVDCSVDNNGLNGQAGGADGLGGSAGGADGALGGVPGTGDDQGGQGGNGGNATATGGIPAGGRGGGGGFAVGGAGPRGGEGGPPPVGHGGSAGIAGGKAGSMGGRGGTPDGGRSGQAMGGAGQDGGGGNPIPGTGGEVAATGGISATGGITSTGGTSTGGASTGGNSNTGGSGATGLGGMAGGAGGCSPTTCMNGCCENNQCIAMRTVDHCGNNGAVCAKCAKCFRCGTSNSCEVDPASPWKLVCTSAVVSAFKADGMTVWDPQAAMSNPASAPPDPVCELKFGATVAAMTSKKMDTLMPVWNESITPSSPALTASRLMSQAMPWSILILDDDQSSTSETICQVSPQLSAAAFTAGTAIVTLTAPLCSNITLDLSCNL